MNNFIILYLCILLIIFLNPKISHVNANNINQFLKFQDVAIITNWIGISNYYEIVNLIEFNDTRHKNQKLSYKLNFLYTTFFIEINFSK